LPLRIIELYTLRTQIDKRDWAKTGSVRHPLDQGKPNQGRKVKSWRQRQKESTQESQTGSWWTVSRRLTSCHIISHYLMCLKWDKDLPYLIISKATKRAIALPEEILVIQPELVSAD
jgi:hypothetical protein